MTDKPTAVEQMDIPAMLREPAIGTITDNRGDVSNLQRLANAWKERAEKAEESLAFADECLKKADEHLARYRKHYVTRTAYDAVRETSNNRRIRINELRAALQTFVDIDANCGGLYAHDGADVNRACKKARELLGLG